MKPALASPASPRSGGFSLLELLVATAVSLLLAVLLVTAATNMIAGYRGAQSGVLQQGDVSFALDQLVLDLEGLSIPNQSGSEGLRLTPETVQGASGQWLTLLATATDDDNSNPPFNGATRAISYRLAFQDPVTGKTDGTNATYGFYRSIAAAKHTFENAIGRTDLQTQYWSAPPAAPAPTPRPPTHADNFLAGNVVAFHLRFLRADNGQWTRADQFVSISNEGSRVADSSAALSEPSSNVPGGFRQIEVAVTVLSQEVTRRVADGTLAIHEAIARFGRTSVRRTAF